MLLGKALGTEGTVTAKDQSGSSGKVDLIPRADVVGSR